MLRLAKLEKYSFTSRTAIVVGFLSFSLVLLSLVVMPAQHDAAAARESAESFNQEELDLPLDEHERWLAAGNCAPDDTNGIADIGRAAFVTFAVETDHSPLAVRRKNLSCLDLSNRKLRCASFVAAVLDGASFFASDLGVRSSRTQTLAMRISARPIYVGRFFTLHACAGRFSSRRTILNPIRLHLPSILITSLTPSLPDRSISSRRR